MKLTIGTRGSKLALTQTKLVAEMLEMAWPDLVCEIEIFKTQGDKSQEAGTPLPEIGGKGLFTAELESALREKRIDLAVHSLKDLPVEDAPGLIVGAIPEREDERDVIVSHSGDGIDELPPGAVVGTSSLRRQSQILFHRPDLVVKSIRGNVDTRIQKVMSKEYDAAILAASGIIRLGIEEKITEYLPLSMMLPAPGQGALGIQCRSNDAQTLSLLDEIIDPTTYLCVKAERTFLQALGGGCSLPVAARVVEIDGKLHLHGRVSTPEGNSRIEIKVVGTDPERLGMWGAELALAQGAERLIGRESSLVGRRVLVTREKNQGKPFVDRLLAKGAIPVPFPVLQFQKLPVPEFENLDINMFDWVLFTSGNAVRFFFENFADNRWQLADKGWQDFKIAVSGSATADVLESYGVMPDFVPEEFVGEQLITGLGEIEGLNILLPRSKRGRPEISKMLLDKGAYLLEIAMYDTIPADPDSDAWALFNLGFDVLTFTSPTAVQHLHTIMENENLNTSALKHKLIASIGPITSQAIKDAGLTVHVEAEPHTIDGMLSAIERHLQQD